MEVAKYRYFIFDLDRTLWDFDLNAKNAIFKLLDKYNLLSRYNIPSKEDFFEQYEIINKRLWDLYESYKITKDYLRLKRFSDTLRLYTADNKVDAIGEAISNEYLDNMVMEQKLIPGTEEVLSWIKEHQGLIAIVTNGFREVQYRKLSNSGIMHYMDAIIISEEIGVHKPSPIIFKRTLESLCKKKGNEFTKLNEKRMKHNAIMIGDDFEKDIEGAQIYGIDQFYYNPFNKQSDGAPTYESSRLKDLIKYCSLTNDEQ